MGLNNRWRTNPFTGVVNSILITEEEHEIEFHPEVNAYGFYANEGIELDPGVPVILVEDNTAQTAFTEIPKTIAPNAGQYRVDYDAEGYFNTGFVNCNSGDVGKNILFTYYGTGTIVHPTFRLQTQFNLPGNLNVEGTSNFEGVLTTESDVVLASGTGATISASNKKIEDVSNPTAATDAVNRQTALTLLGANTGFELLTTSGNWVCPENVTEVLYGAIGGGGGGAGAFTTDSRGGGGGGGGGLIFGIQSVTPGNSYAYTVGSAGSAGVQSATLAGSYGGNGGDTTIFSRTAGGGKGGYRPSSSGSGDVIGSTGGEEGSGANGGGGGGGGGLLGGIGVNGVVGSSTSAGGTAGGFLGGKGGDGSRTAAAGSAGANYGAGGGGGAYSGGTGYNGGAGAPGAIILIY